MKRLFLMLSCVALAFVSCDELDSEGGKIGGNDKGDIVTPAPTPSPELTPSQQKTKLADVAEEIMATCPADEFEHVVSVLEDFTEFFEDGYYDTSELENWFYQKSENIMNAGSVNTTVKGNKVTNSYFYGMVIYLSNYEGLFTFGEDAVTVSKYNGTKAVFSLNGNKYEAEIKTQGNVTKALYVNESWYKENQYGYYNAETGEWVETDNLMEVIEKNKESITVGVPDKLIISLTENGSSLAKITMEFETAFSKNGITPTTDAFAVSAKVEFNGYELAVNNTSYNGKSGKAEVSYGLKKDGKSIFLVSASANVKIAMNDKVYEEGYDDYSYSYSYTEVEVTKADKISVGLDIMGEIQAVGSFTDAFAAESVIENMWDALYNENISSAENYLEQINEMLDFGIYYKGSNKQADIEMEIVEYNDGWEDYYDIAPVLVFNDDSRYAFEDYFTEKAFESVINSFYELVEDYENVFGYIFEEDYYYN